MRQVMAHGRQSSGEEGTKQYGHFNLIKIKKRMTQNQGCSIILKLLFSNNRNSVLIPKE